MTVITTERDFQKFLQEEKAVLFVYFDWSGQAAISLKLFQEWEYEWKTAHADERIGFYRLNPEELPACWNWLTKQAQAEDGVDGGFGSVIWLCKGQRINFVRYAAKAGKETLSRVTEKSLNQPHQLSPGTPSAPKKLQDFCG